LNKKYVENAYQILDCRQKNENVIFSLLFCNVFTRFALSVVGVPTSPDYFNFLKKLLMVLASSVCCVYQNRTSSPPTKINSPTCGLKQHGKKMKIT